jgi:hypothetical protein
MPSSPISLRERFGQLRGAPTLPLKEDKPFIPAMEQEKSSYPWVPLGSLLLGYIRSSCTFPSRSWILTEGLSLGLGDGLSSLFCPRATTVPACLPVHSPA